MTFKKIKVAGHNAQQSYQSQAIRIQLKPADVMRAFHRGLFVLIGYYFTNICLFIMMRAGGMGRDFQV